MSKIQLREDLINAAATELLFLDSSEEDEAFEVIDDLEENLAVVSYLRYSFQSYVPKNISWFENILPNYDEKRFKMYLRVKKIQFFLILDMISKHEVFTGINSDKQFSPCFQLALVLYRLGSSGEGASYAKVAALFGIGDGGTIEKITSRVFKAILSLEKVFLKWPTKEERKNLIAETMHELPHCIGYLDGSEIPLAEAPHLDSTSYFSRKKQYSIKMQAICDKDIKIRHIFVGYPGSVHDSRMYNNSSIGKNPNKFLSEQEYIAADSAYKLTTHIITPFRSNSRSETSENKKKFNKIFSSYRVRIENCFGFLKEIFGSLKGLRIQIHNENSHKQCCLWITICCILYNIVLPYWDEEEWVYLCDEENSENYSENENNNDSDKMGELKRKALFNNLVQ